MVAEVFKPADYAVIQTSATELEDRFNTASENIGASFTIKYVCGIAVGREGLIESDFSRPMDTLNPADRFSENLGEWLAIAADRKNEHTKYLVFGDSYGYCPIFYALVKDRGVVVSDSFGGACAGLEELGTDPKLDFDNYVATVSAAATQFTNPTVVRTMAEQIKILPMDAALLITDRAAIRLPRSTVSAVPQGASYEQLISQGNELVQESLNKLTNSLDVPMGLLLSGGVDSRLVLGQIKAAGLVKSFSVRTSDPRDYKSAYSQRVFERDAGIANELRQRLGMNWMRREQAQSLSVSFRESLAAFQRYNSNFSYAFRPTWGLTIQGRPIVTLRGGGGEILRSTGTGWNIDKAVRADPSLENEDSSRKLVSWYMKSSNKTAVFQERVEQFMSDELAVLRGKSLVEKLNSHYLHTRNRTHFGHTRASRSLNELPLQFLSNSYYLEAASKIPFQDKAEGALVQEIFASTAPELLKFPFESLEWHKRLATAGTRKDVDDPNAWLAEFDWLKKHQPKSTPRQGWEKGARGEYFAHNSVDAARTYLNAAFDLLNDVTGDDHLRAFHQEVGSLIDSSDLKAPTTVAKVASAVDVFFPSTTRGVSLRLQTTRNRALQQLTSSRVIWPTVYRDGWNNVPVPDIRPTICREGSKIIVDAGVRVQAEAGQTFAFYLLSNGRRIAQQWYSSEQRAVFDAPADQKTLVGKVFVKTPRSSKPILITETGPLSGIAVN